MAELPILPINTEILLADTTHMTAEEFGAYTRILLVMWRHGGKLKNDDTDLARIAGVPLLRWRRIRATVLAPFTITEDGTMSQKRLTDTRIRVQARRRRLKPRGV